MAAQTAEPSTREMPYKSYTGTVHQFGFVGGMYYTANPNYTPVVGGSAADTDEQTFHDYGLGVTYTMHDYVTRQFTFDLLSSITLVTEKSLRQPGDDRLHQKLIWPVDCRFYLGPSEDLQAYIGTGLQWTMLQKTSGERSMMTGMTPTKTIHQLSGNTSVGFNFLGPQKYMVHFNIGAKLHYPISSGNTDFNNSVPSGSAAVPDASPSGTVDLARDRGCVVLNGGITVDIDRHKNACVMLNYDYPLGTPKAQGASGFFNNTQTIALALLFHIGGTR